MISFNLNVERGTHRVMCAYHIYVYTYKHTRVCILCTRIHHPWHLSKLSLSYLPSLDPSFPPSFPSLLSFRMLRVWFYAGISQWLEPFSQPSQDMSLRLPSKVWAASAKMYIFIITDSGDAPHTEIC